MKISNVTSRHCTVRKTHYIQGSSSNIHESIVAALRLKNMGITIYTAGVGSYVNVEELQGAATNPSYYFNTASYTSLQSLEGPITMSACEGEQSTLLMSCTNMTRQKFSFQKRFIFVCTIAIYFPSVLLICNSYHCLI
jgi:hypothetical protein